MTSALPAVVDQPLAPSRLQRQRQTGPQLPPFLLPVDTAAPSAPAEVPDSVGAPSPGADDEPTPRGDPGDEVARPPRDMPVPPEAPPAASEHQPAEGGQPTVSARHVQPKPTRVPPAPAPLATAQPASGAEDMPAPQAAAPVSAQARPAPPAGPQLPPLRLETPHSQPPPARGAAAADAVVQAIPPAAPATPPPAPADIRISAPGEQALQVTLVTGSPDLRDRLTAARPDLRADLARVGAEVDLIAVELRTVPGEAGAGSGLSRPDAGSGNMGNPNGNPGGEADAMAIIQADSCGAADKDGAAATGARLGIPLPETSADAGSNPPGQPGGADRVAVDGTADAQAFIPAEAAPRGANPDEAAPRDQPAGAPWDRPGERGSRPGSDGGYPPPRPRVPPQGSNLRPPAGPDPSAARTIDRYA